ncbi:MAG: beta-propeller fold lactonase family protein [Burkholderiales bacterium]|nr:beta-propeller fold lactonase family protein [Burkholderiales bacterium]
MPQSFVAVHPSQRLIYFSTAAGTQGFLCAYRYDPVALTLTPAPGSPFATGGAPVDSFAIDPSGTFLYAVSINNNAVAAFAIDAATGALTRLAGSPYPTAANPSSVAVDPTGRFVYVATSAFKTFASTISAYAIDAATGALAPLPGSPYAVPDYAYSVAVDPLGRFAYLTTADSLQAYAINPATGVLKPVGAPVAGSGSLAVDPSGRFVYVKSQQYIEPNLFVGLRAYRVEANGSLTAIGGLVEAGEYSQSIAVSRSGRHVYMTRGEQKTDSSGTKTFVYGILGFARDEATGALTPIAGSPFPLGEVNPSSIVTFNVLPSQSGWAAGVPMFYPLGVSGGYPPYAWSAAGGTLPPGLSVDSALGALRGTPTTPGTYEFVAQVADSRGAVATKSYRFVVAGGAPPAIATIVEFYHGALDHYFITWIVDEIAKLDAGTTIKGWARTGKTFNTYTAAQAGSSPICRYYIPPGLGDSHFFGRGTVECNATGAANPTFVLEEPNFMHMLLPSAGVCPTGTTPVYRVFSARPDANHRYTVERAVRDAMVAKGWQAEGDGPDLVVMCAP